MNIEFVTIDRSNYEACINLKVNPEQKTFVAPNLFSLVQSQYEPELFPLGILVNKELVGFLLYDFDLNINGWSMSRFMIDINHQNKGIGRKALNKFLDFFVAKHGHLGLYTSVSINNPNAKHLYESVGFVQQDAFEYTIDGTVYKEYRMYLQL